MIKSDSNEAASNRAHVLRFRKHFHGSLTSHGSVRFPQTTYCHLRWMNASAMTTEKVGGKNLCMLLTSQCA